MAWNAGDLELEFLGGEAILYFPTEKIAGVVNWDFKDFCGHV